jgi:signal peptidase I
MVLPISNDTSTISLSVRDLDKYHLHLKRFIIKKGVAPSELAEEFKAYTPDNLGPVKVPDNSYFLLGDNRHNALDSRYTGFIKAQDVVSTVIR